MTQDNYIRRTARALWSFGLLLLALTASAQFSYTTIGSNYTQNFSTLGTANITVAGGNLNTTMPH